MYQRYKYIPQSRMKNPGMNHNIYLANCDVIQRKFRVRKYISLVHTRTIPRNSFVRINHEGSSLTAAQFSSMRRVAAVILVFLLGLPASRTLPPNIVFILADDLGWNDVSFHGSNEISTPNIDALAYCGIILNNHYSQPLCTPSRAALLTGKYPIHNGMQKNLILEPEPWGLPLTEVLLPQYLSNLNYTSHIVGKWHLGYFKKAYTPTYRGFASHYGFWNGFQDYYSHMVQASFVPYEGYDMRRNLEIAVEAQGHYSTDLFTEEAVNIITQHDPSNSSLFLYLSHLATHAGNYENPLQAPADVISKFRYIKEPERRLYAAMTWKLDESVGKVMWALQQKGILNNTIVAFVSDNGAATNGIHSNKGSNWPLRGEKGTPWEGSSRTVALLWSTTLQKKKRISSQLMHITDWLPTLYSAAGGDVSDIKNIDGIDMWDVISQDLPSPRTKLLVNIDDNVPYTAMRLGKYKYINGSTFFGHLDTWTDNPDRNSSLMYDTEAVLNSLSANAIASLPLENRITSKDIEELRKRARIYCSGPTKPCRPLQRPCIFDIELDPCEMHDLYEQNSNIVRDFELEIANYQRTAVEPNNKRSEKLANPKYWNNTWTFWGDLPAPTQIETGRRV
ncbi:arylsulfatase B-like [Periplaneta americana]|uniref:arylsulfatase B-like n=1 Tax=Periplaneta americana TaxID=6978 RepID=UPI0037E97C6E